MSETVFTLNKNYRVKNKEFRDLLGMLCTGEPTEQDADIILNLHIGLHKSDMLLWTICKTTKNHVVDVSQLALPTMWGLGRTSTERRNGIGF